MLLTAFLLVALLTLCDVADLVLAYVSIPILCALKSTSLMQEEPLMF